MKKTILFLLLGFCAISTYAISDSTFVTFDNGYFEGDTWGDWLGYADITGDQTKPAFANSLKLRVDPFNPANLILKVTNAPSGRFGPAFSLPEGIDLRNYKSIRFKVLNETEVGQTLFWRLRFRYDANNEAGTATALVWGQDDNRNSGAAMDIGFRGEWGTKEFAFIFNTDGEILDMANKVINPKPLRVGMSLNAPNNSSYGANYSLDDIVLVAKTGTGLKDLALIPNFIVGEGMIHFTGSEEKNLSIWSIDGKKVMSLRFSGEKSIALNKGLYLVSVNGINQKCVVR